MKILHMTLKKKWFDLIRSGKKTIEYREIKPYWRARLIGKDFDAIEFRNGYGKNKPSFIIELKKIGVETLFFSIANFDKGQRVYALHLGKVISSQNTGSGKQ